MSSTFANFRQLRVDAKFTIGTEAANVINVAIQLIDRENGNELGEAVAVQYYLATDSAGQAVASDPGDIVIGTDGTIITEFTTDVCGLVVSEADGDIDFDVTHTLDNDYYLVLIMPDGKLQISSILGFVHGAS